MVTRMPQDFVPVPGDPGFPVDPGFPGMPADPVGLVAGGSALIGIVVLLFIGAVVFGIWRMVVVNSASKQLGLSDEQRFLAVTDEQAGAAIVTGAIISDAIAGRAGAGRADAGGTGGTGGTGDLSERLEGLQAALDRGLITADEFAASRRRILNEA